MATLTNCNLHPHDHVAVIPHKNVHYVGTKDSLACYDAPVYIPAVNSFGNEHSIFIADEKSGSYSMYASISLIL